MGQTAVEVSLDNLGNDRKGVLTIVSGRAFSGSSSLHMDYTEDHTSMFPRVGVRLVPKTEEVDTGYKEVYSSIRMN